MIDKYNKNHLAFFSLLGFFVIFVSSFITYIISAHQINSTRVSQELKIASDNIKLSLSTELGAEIALLENLGHSPTIRSYFTNPEDNYLKRLAFAELDMFYKYSKGGIIYWINDIDKMFHTSGTEPYRVDPDLEINYWYNLTLYESDGLNFNINYNPDIDMISLWLNVAVYEMSEDENPKPIGMLGTGLDLPRIIELVETACLEVSPEITAFLFNKFDEITIASDLELINQKVLLNDHLGLPGMEVLNVARDLKIGEEQIFHYGTFRYKVELISVIKDWYILLRYPSSGILAMFPQMNLIFFGMLFLIMALIAVMNYIVTKSSKDMADQNARLYEANIDLENQRTIAQSANRAKSDFLAKMSHEIRTPLNAIIGTSQIELQSYNRQDRYTQALDKIYTSGCNLLGIINDILDLSKIETGKMEITKVEYHLPSLIHDAVQLNILQIGSKELEFILDLSPELPSKLIGDELRIKQILNNLLSNAIKYSPKGHVKLSVFNSECEHISEEEAHSEPDNLGYIYLNIIVEDTGQGLKPEDCQRLFSEYLRFNISETRTIQGTGIGLNITKSLIELMEGSIDVESEFGVGSKFSVKIKQQTVQCEPLGLDLVDQLCTFKFSSNKHHSNLQISRSPMPNGKVLIVDDVETNLYVAKGLMMPYQLSIETVLSGEKAIELVKEGKEYDVIFMDHMMPIMDGIETTKILRTMDYQGTIVALTANALSGNAQMFKENGFDDFISKPIDVRILNTILNTYVKDKSNDNLTAPTSEPLNITNNDISNLDQDLIKIIKNDIKNAITTLKETIAKEDIKLLTTTVHGLKTILLNVNENEMANQAAKLEEAGINNDKSYITNHIYLYILDLENILSTLTEKEIIENENENIIEDIPYLIEQLNHIKTACEKCDDSEAYKILDQLKVMTWKKNTKNTLEKIHINLYLHSDFEETIIEIMQVLSNLASA